MPGANKGQFIKLSMKRRPRISETHLKLWISKAQAQGMNESP